MRMMETTQSLNLGGGKGVSEGCHVPKEEPSNQRTKGSVVHQGRTLEQTHVHTEGKCKSRIG